MANANKNKGKSFERELAKQLSNIFQLSFQRCGNSGAFIGGSNAFRREHLSKSQDLLACGDLIVPDELRRTAFEAKFYKDFSFSSLFSSNAILDQWIKQAETTDKLWFLVFKINHAGAFVVFNNFYTTFLQTDNHLVYKRNYIITSMENFFEINKNDILKFNSENERPTTILSQVSG